MATPDPREVSWVIAELATRAIEKAADADQRHLEQAMRDWFPDVDGYLGIRELANQLRAGLQSTAQLFENRNRRLIAEGIFRPITPERSAPDGADDTGQGPRAQAA